MSSSEAIRDLLDRVRARWRRLVFLRGVTSASLGLSVAVTVLLVAALWIPERPWIYLVAGTLTAVACAVVLLRAFAPMRRPPSNLTLARFIEERESTLNDRLVSAVGLLHADDTYAPALAAPMLADAARAASAVDVSAIVPPARLRAFALRAIAAVVMLGAIIFTGRHTLVGTLDAASVALFPSRIALQVTPGHTRVQSGAVLQVEARLAGNRAPVVAYLLRTDNPNASPEELDAWHRIEMPRNAAGGFVARVEAVNASFRYLVRAGGISSEIFNVTVARAPRVTRIDVEYHYPSALGMSPDTQEDTGDVYAPPGTDVRLKIRTDPPAASGQLVFADGKTVALAADGPAYSGVFTISDNTSYRVGLADAGGLKSDGDTEYFVRTLTDRPPDVHVIKPARDRRVTMLEEVDVEASAEDDIGLARLELVYAVSGGTELVLPFPISRHATSASGTKTIFLEDLNVQPGDFVSYYVRARDEGRGATSQEGRSDIFFLEVRPFEQEFALAQSQMMSARGSRSVDALVAAQKEVIVATWKLERRRQASAGAQSSADVKSVARTESELRIRVQEASSAFRESTMRDPRQRNPAAPPTPAGEDAMSAASRAMGQAATALSALKTSDALPPEMEALNHLLRAQASLKRQQISRQDAGAGGENRSNEDLSNLFDRELQRQQQTNYETPQTTEQKSTGGVTDAIKDLARRQDELNSRQQSLSSQPPEERQRELDRLAREQQQLREKAEAIAQELAKSAQGSQGSRGSRGSQGSQGSQGSPGAQGFQGSQGSQSQQMRAISEDMRGAASDLQRRDPGQASQRGARAVQRLRELERQLRTASPDERKRVLGDLQLEARQIADAERQLASELGRGAGSGSVGSDRLRRAAGEQQQLADRARRVQDGLREQAAAMGGSPNKSDASQLAIGNAARDADRQRVAERMQQSAEQLRAAASDSDAQKVHDAAARAAAAQQAAASDLDDLASKIARARTPQDADSQRLSDQRARAQQLRQDLDDLTRQLEQVGRGQAPDSSANGGRQMAGDAGRAGRGQSANGGGGGDLARLRDQYEQKLRESRDLLDQMRRDDPSFSQGGPGLTFEGQGMTLSSPGTEAFKQDFAKWEQLHQQATQLLQRAETSLSDRLRARSGDRLAAGADDRAPAAYQQPVNDYFKALAKKPAP